MQQEQAELEARLQHKQLQVVTAAQQFRPVMANLDKVCQSSCYISLDLAWRDRICTSPGTVLVSALQTIAT